MFITNAITITTNITVIVHININIAVSIIISAPCRHVVNLVDRVGEPCAALIKASVSVPDMRKLGNRRYMSCTVHVPKHC